MDEKRLIELLEAVQDGRRSIAEAVGDLRQLPFEDLGFARYDTHRALRVGFAEVILGQGKTPEQIAALFAAARRHHPTILATRVAPDCATRVIEHLRLSDPTLADELEHDPLARCLVSGRAAVEPTGIGTVCVVCAGTADLPVASEAALTAEVMGARVERIVDVGVAGLHRLLAVRPQLEAASVIVVVAGMEGALVSVVAGLVDVPVIAVPTSVGYGTHLGGVVPLLAMLNSCAAGVTVVNIDNGFGAGYTAALITRAR